MNPKNRQILILASATIIILSSFLILFPLFPRFPTNTSNYSLLLIKPSPALPSSALPSDLSPEALAQGKALAKVGRVIDGDTFDTTDGERIRLIGIDAPELHGTDDIPQCFAKESAVKLRQLIENQEIQLEKDVSDTDKYGRRLRYVWKDGVLINELLIKEGFAKIDTFPPDVKYQQQLMVAQKNARDGEIGIWSACK